ncbi:MAG: MFS transporter [Candidatus Hermodarchaeota archaeon]
MESENNSDENVSLDEGEERSLAKAISYGSLWFTDNLILSFFGVVVFYFYEVEVGLNVLLVAIAFIIFAIWNMINDPLLGYLTELPKSEKRIMRYGFRTPWIYLSAIVMLIVFVLVFLPPEGSSQANQIAIFIYMLILICFLDGCYTIYNSHMAGGAINIFKTEKNRRQVGAYAVIFSTLGLVTVNAIILPTVIVYGDRNSFVLAAGLTSIAMLINIIVFSYGIKEPKEVKEYYLRGREKEKGEKIPFIQVIKTALRSKNFVVYIVAFLLWATAYNLFYASQVYFYKDVLKVDFANFTFGVLALLVGFLLGMPVWLKISKKYGISNIYGLGYILLGILFFSFMWISTIMEVVIYMFLGGFCYSASACILIPVQADTYDEVTSNLGVHQEATLQGITNLFIRLAYLFIGIIIAAVHILTNYNPNPLASQTALAVLGVRIHSGLIPGIILIIAGVCFLLIYDLKGDKKLRVQEQLKNIMEGKV